MSNDIDVIAGPSMAELPLTGARRSVVLIDLLLSRTEIRQLAESTEPTATDIASTPKPASQGRSPCQANASAAFQRDQIASAKEAI